MTEEVLTTARLLFSPGQVVEVRAITDDGMASGYFDSPEELAARVEVLDALPGTVGIYVTLNEVNPALLARRANRIKVRLSKKDVTTADSDIVRRCWFPVDIDPVRPSGVSSSDEEHQAAMGKARTVARFLSGMGWLEPVLADSGNGAHLLYRIDLPNDDASRDLVRKALETLAVLFDDPISTIDTANYNAARIWKLYGTMSRKGDNLPERPHRRSAIISAPHGVQVVDRTSMEHLAYALPDAPPPEKKEEPHRPGKAIDLSIWLSRNGIGIRKEKPYQGGTLFVLDGCPFSGAHRDGAFAIQFPNGAIHAGCHHASCGGGEQRWPELRERYERKEKKKTKSFQPHREDPCTPAAISLQQLPGWKEAMDILQHGDPMQEMLRAFALDHEGDETAAACLILSLASRSVINTNGLHVSVTGESGKGKSHAFTTMLTQVPERYRLSGAMSNKALFYIDELVPGMAIVLDDTSLSEDMADILKGVTTSFRRPFIYRTVNKDRRGHVCIIPERCVWWVAKVEGSGDDQVFNRMLTCWIDDSPEQDGRVITRILHQNTTLPGHGIGERPEVQVCRAMWEVLGQQRFYVVIPFADRIRFQAIDNRRNPDMLLDLLKAHTLLRFMQRERMEDAGVLCLVATREDFDEAVRLYKLLNGTSGGQMTKLTKKESDLVVIIGQSGWEEFTIPMLQKATGLSNGTLHKLLHGFQSRGTVYSGLLQKCPAIAYSDRTVTSVDVETNETVRRRTNAYTFDRDLYQKWCAGGAVWIEGDTDEGDDDGDDPSALPQSFRNTSANVEGPQEADATRDSALLRYTTHLDVPDHQSSSKSGYIESHEQASPGVSAHTSDPEIAAVPEQKPEENHPIIVSSPVNHPNALPQQPADRQNEPLFVAGVEGYPRHRIKAADYKRLDTPEGRTPCHTCGKTGIAWYVEKMTPDRERRKEEPARRICQRCYDMAVRRERAAAPPLPGTINLTVMKRRQSDIGRCSVCNMGRAVYQDKDAGVRLCESCYARESRQKAEGRT